MRLDDVHAMPAPRAAGRRLQIALIGNCGGPGTGPGTVVCSGQHVHVHVRQLAHELSRSGHLVDIFTRRDAPGQPQVVQLDERIRLVHVPAGPPGYVPNELMLAHVDAFSRFVTRFMRRQGSGYDIVHAHFFMGGMVAQHLKAALGLPFVVTFHALERAHRRVQAAADAFSVARVRIESTLMRAADRLIAEYPQDRADMQQLYGAPASRIEVVPCGFSPGELYPVPMTEARARLGLEQDRFTVLQLGRMAPRKGVDTVIQGLALLRRRHGLDARLLVAGGNAGSVHDGNAPARTGGDARAHPGNGIDSDGPELARLRQLAADLGIAAQVRFAGHQPRSALRDWYSAANVFASTPWYEPFGTTPVEAMACARPVVGSEVGGIKSTVADGVTGFLVPSRDPEALAERLARLHRQPELARAMGEAGRRRACEHYTWHHVAGQLAAIYTEVLDDTRPAAVPAMLSTSGSRRA